MVSLLLIDHSLEYSALIETSQTHSQRVHHKFYVKKRRVVQDALTIPAAYEKITPPCPLLSIETNKYEELRENQLSAVDPLDPLTSLDSPTNNSSPHPTIDIGSARADYGIKGKRFPWLQEEIDYFHYYMNYIEPGLEEEDKNRKYATCLRFILAASVDVVKYFHPHHLENSDRVKTGYLKALESFHRASDEENL
jgi:hypothetical protein